MVEHAEDIKKDLSESSVCISEESLRNDECFDCNFSNDQHKISSVISQDRESTCLHSYPDSPVSISESSCASDTPHSKRKKRKVNSYSSHRKSKRNMRKEKDMYEVEYILDVIEHGEDSFFLVKWKRWGSEFNSWEPRDNLTNCNKIIEEFFSGVYGNLSNSRKDIDAFASSLVNPSRQLLEDLMCSLVENDKVKYDVCSLHKVCMTISSLLSIPENERNNDTINKLERDIMLRCLHVKRLRQLRSLKEWEHEINASSNHTAAITVENEVDLEGPPENFFYINDYLPGAGVSIPDEPPIGCTCKVCNASTCNCVEESGNKFPYNADRTIRISGRFPIYECNKLCSCSDACINRVVQKGSQVRLGIFRTRTGCGWGVKALENIPKGTFVCEYVGEIISSEQAEERGKKYDVAGQTYLFDLDFNDADQCPFTVDAMFFGNISHFLNHSCSPNVSVHAVWVNCLDPDMPKLAFFAKKPIGENQEITFDYNAQTVNPRASVSNISCKCKSINCRKYLF